MSSQMNMTGVGQKQFLNTAEESNIHSFMGDCACKDSDFLILFTESPHVREISLDFMHTSSEKKPCQFSTINFLDLDRKGNPHTVGKITAQFPSCMWTQVYTYFLDVYTHTHVS